MKEYGLVIKKEIKKLTISYVYLNPKYEYLWTNITSALQRFMQKANNHLTWTGGAAFALGQPKGGSNLIACACHFHRLQSAPSGRTAWGFLRGVDKWLWENVDGASAAMSVSVG